MQKKQGLHHSTLQQDENEQWTHHTPAERRTVLFPTEPDFHLPHAQQISKEKITLLKWVRDL